MSVWPKTLPESSTLSGREGALVSISIHVDPRHLERLLEALAQVSFPVNPQIYHDALMVYRYADGREEAEPTTLVEFPAYAERLDEVSGSLAAIGLDPTAARVTSMLDEIHAAPLPEPAPPGAPYVASYRLKHRVATAH